LRTLHWQLYKQHAEDNMPSLSQHLRELHQSLRHQQPDLTRIAVALYDADTDMLSTYACSCDIDNPLLQYRFPLQQSRSLQQIADTGKSRVINDLRIYADNPTRHSQALLQAGYRSSFTVPIRMGKQLQGFIFFNAEQCNHFNEEQLVPLEIAALAISLLVSQQRAQILTLQAALKTAITVTHERNHETGEHLIRMTDYSRFACRILGPQLGLSDEYITHLIQFSSLHDIGKISTPDHVLLKPGKLTTEEFEVIKGHTSGGLKIIDDMIENHALSDLEHIQMLREIVELHHENWDGSGYPHGLKGEQIPLAARIVAACDAFDAITTERPYKDPIPTTQALQMITQMRGQKLDPLCADILLQHPDEINAIRRQHHLHGLV